MYFKGQHNTYLLVIMYMYVFVKQLMCMVFIFLLIKAKQKFTIETIDTMSTSTTPYHFEDIPTFGIEAITNNLGGIWCVIAKWLRYSFLV